MKLKFKRKTDLEQLIEEIGIENVLSTTSNKHGFEVTLKKDKKLDKTKTDKINVDFGKKFNITIEDIEDMEEELAPHEKKEIRRKQK